MKRFEQQREPPGPAREFVTASWSATVRYHPESIGDLIGLPHPYTVPTMSRTFQEMYYWDTYFTNEGLVLDGRTDLALNNVENIAHLVARYGCMPNGNRTWFENRSQPPYLAMMVDRIFVETEDLAWLARMSPIVEREYEFWMTRRLTPCGLNRYSHGGTSADCADMVDILRSRLGASFERHIAPLTRSEVRRIGSHHLAEAESGWDFTPRFDMRCQDFCPIDLNANLYRYETTLARWATLFDRPDAADAWLALARRRRNLLRLLCRDPATGAYFDYDYTRAARSTVCSAATFSLFFARLLSPHEATTVAKAALDRLEFAHGIAACADAAYEHGYQWSFPNTWAPLDFLAAVGLDRYGLHVDARRIARSYVDLVERNFETTGNLWEKYNVVRGDTQVGAEYAMPSMMGWTAGVLAWAGERLAREDLQPVP